MDGNVAVKTGLLGAIIKAMLDAGFPIRLILEGIQYGFEETNKMNVEIINVTKKSKKNKNKEEAFEDLLKALKDELE